MEGIRLQEEKQLSPRLVLVRARPLAWPLARNPAVRMMIRVQTFPQAFEPGKILDVKSPLNSFPGKARRGTRPCKNSFQDSWLDRRYEPECGDEIPGSSSTALYAWPLACIACAFSI